MTLCIAAACQDQGNPRIVVCSDWKVDAHFTGSETLEKQDFLMPGWLSLIAGNVARARELQIAFRDYLTQNPPRFNGVLSAFKEAVNLQKARLANEYMQTTLMRSYDWLLSDGREALGETHYFDLLAQVETLRLEAEMILCGFIKGEQDSYSTPVLGVIDDRGHRPFVRMEDNFAAIGSGAVIADATLHRRAQEWDMPLKKTLYNVYEAKKMGEAATGVGANSTIGVLLTTGRYMNISDVARGFLDGCLTKYGPKPLSEGERWDELPNDFVVPLEPLAASSAEQG